MNEAINPDGLAKPSGVWSTVVVAGAMPLVFVSGLTSRDPEGRVVGEGDIAAQTRRVLENLKIALAAAGSSLDRIVSVTVHVTDIERFDEIHRVRREYFPRDPPASTMVQVARLVDPRSLIEISAIATL